MSPARDKGNNNLNGKLLYYSRAGDIGVSPLQLTQQFCLGGQLVYSCLIFYTFDYETVPASDNIVASADTRIQVVELLDLQGGAVVSNAANYVNVASIPAGVYLLPMHDNGLTSTHKVAIVH